LLGHHVHPAQEAQQGLLERQGDGDARHAEGDEGGHPAVRDDPEHGDSGDDEGDETENGLDAVSAAAVHRGGQRERRHDVVARGDGERDAHGAQPTGRDEREGYVVSTAVPRIGGRTAARTPLASAAST